LEEPSDDEGTTSDTEYLPECTLDDDVVHLEELPLVDVHVPKLDSVLHQYPSNPGFKELKDAGISMPDDGPQLKRVHYPNVTLATTYEKTGSPRTLRYPKPCSSASDLPSGDFSSGPRGEEDLPRKSPFCLSFHQVSYEQNLAII
jgi:hypothetical protein